MSKIILIDNGHGQNTRGKCSPDKSLLEWKYAREIANKVQSKLKDLGYDVRLITPEETDISLSVRTRRVNEICKQYGSQNCLLIICLCLLFLFFVQRIGQIQQWMLLPNRILNVTVLFLFLLLLSYVTQVKDSFRFPLFLGEDFHNP